MTTDSVSKQAVVEGAGWSDRRDGQGRRHARPRAGHDARRRSPPTPSSRPPTSTQALRAATRVSFDRLDSDGCMSTNDTVTVMASGASGITPVAARLHRRPDPAVHRPGDAAAPRRRGLRPRHRDHHAQRRQRGRRRRGRAQRRPQQPLQGRRLRQGPQLGSRPGLDRHHLGRLRPRRPRRRHQRRLGLPAAPPRPRTRPRSTSGPARSP